MKRALGFMNKSQAIVYNTYIGGVSATISTPALLATKLGISVGNISNFEVVGSDIKCFITGSYSMPNQAFLADTSLTYYSDIDGLITSLLGNSCFQNTNNAIYFYFPNLTTINGGAHFSILGNNKLQYIYIPRCTSLGTTSGNNNIFTYTTGKYIVYVDSSLATNNGGLPDDDLPDVIIQGGIVRYVSNFTAPSAVSTLANGTIYATAIQLNLTAPSSTNAIDYYECYEGGVFKNNITASGDCIYNLTASTSYGSISVIAVDVFMNKSPVSNSISVTTAASNPTDSEASSYITASSNSVYATAINDLYCNLKGQNLYSKIQAFYPNIGTASQQKYNGKNPLDTDAAFRQIYSGTATFSDLGYTPNGSNGYANTKFIPSANQNVNSNGLTLVIGTNNTPTSNDVWDIGAYNGGSQCSFFAAKRGNARNTIEGGFNSYNINALSNTDAKGVYTAQRIAPIVSNVFKNSTILQKYGASGTLTTYPMLVGCFNYIGSPITFSNQRFQFIAFHESFTYAEVSLFHAIINTFENALGRKTW